MSFLAINSVVLAKVFSVALISAPSCLLCLIWSSWSFNSWNVFTWLPAASSALRANSPPALSVPDSTRLSKKVNSLEKVLFNFLNIASKDVNAFTTSCVSAADAFNTFNSSITLSAPLPLTKVSIEFSIAFINTSISLDAVSALIAPVANFAFNSVNLDIASAAEVKDSTFTSELSLKFVILPKFATMSSVKPLTVCSSSRSSWSWSFWSEKSTVATVAPDLAASSFTALRVRLFAAIAPAPSCTPSICPIRVPTPTIPFKSATSAFNLACSADADSSCCSYLANLSV